MLLLLAAFQAPSRLEPAMIDGEFTRWADPDWTHPLGTDGDGYDMWSEVGTAAMNTTKLFSLPIVLFIVLGITLGVALGNSKGTLVQLTNSVFNILNSFPLLMLILLVIIMIDGFFDTVTGFQKSNYTLIFFSVVASTKLGTDIRGRIESLRNEDFVESAEAIGLSWWVITFKHILFYYCSNSIISHTMNFINQLLFLEVTLSYLKLTGSVSFMTFGELFKKCFSYFNVFWSFDRWQALVPSIIIMYLIALFTVSAKKVSQHVFN